MGKILVKLGTIFNFFHVLTNFFLAFETELLLRPNLGASHDAPDAPSHTSMHTDTRTQRHTDRSKYIKIARPTGTLRRLSFRHFLVANTLYTILKGSKKWKKRDFCNFEGQISFGGQGSREVSLSYRGALLYHHAI